MKSLLGIISGMTVFGLVIFSNCTSEKNDTNISPITETEQGEELITHPNVGTNVQTKYNRRVIQYAQVNKAGDYFRRMFIDSASAATFTQTGTIPNSAIFYLETWFGNNQSTVYIRQKSNNEWQSNSFSPSNPVYTVAFDQSCQGCHTIAQSTETVFTLPLLKKALSRKTIQVIECNQTSFNPCDLATYEGN